MAERQRAHIAICRENNTIRAHKDYMKSSRSCVNQFKSPDENVLENVIPQGKSGRYRPTDALWMRRKKKHPFIHTSLTIVDARRVVATWCHCDHFHFCIFYIFAMHFEEIHFHFVLVSILSVGNTAKAPNGSHSIPPVCDWPALTSLRH